MANTFKPIAVELTGSSWTQLQTVEATPANYSVPTGYRADLGNFAIHNLNGTDVVTVQLAISPDATPTNVQLITGSGIEIEAGGFVRDNDVREIIPEGWALWAKAAGTSPSVVVHAVVLEKA